MSALFLKIVNMSISASWLVVAVLLLRLVLKKAPKWVSVLLWGFVAVRLICPFSIESVLSLIPSAETISPEIMMDWTPEISTGSTSLDTVVNPIITESFAPKPYASANPLQILIPVCGNLWVLGVLVMLVYTAVSYILLRHKIATAVLLRSNIYQSESVDSPFVLGIIKPKIYLPFQMDSQNLEHVIAHEESHIRRKDHWWKPIGFVLLAIHWFNPLMWLGYILLCRDIELACDEKVIQKMDSETKADYTQALVACSVNRRSIAACPLAFGEVGVKERVKSVMNYKKPAFWIVLAAVIVCVIVAVCFLTNPMDQISFCKLSNDEVNMPGVLSNVTAMTVTYEGISIDCADQADINRFLATLDKIRASKEPISLNRSEDRSKDFTIKINGNTELHFNKYFTEFWVDDKVKPSLTHRITNPETAKELLLDYNFTVSSLAGTDPSGTVTGEIENPSPGDILIPSLQEKYPDYFSLDAANGLDVYVWQMAENSYSFGLLPHSETMRDWMSSALMELKGARAEEMRVILAAYAVSQDDIHVIPWQNPLSSYIGEYWIITEGEDLEAKRRAYVENIRKMLFAAAEVTYSEFTAKSGENAVQLISLPAGATLRDYVNAVSWLTVKPDEAEHVPFSMWKNGEEVFAGYDLFDAETCERIYHAVSTAHAPQTWIFRRVDHTRNYIIFMTKSAEPNPQIYAFGVKFKDTVINNRDSDPIEIIYGNRKTYYKNADGTWQVDGRNYKYRLRISGRMHDAINESTFAYLSNLETITFEQAWKAAYSSNADDVFSAEEAVLVESGAGSITVIGGAEDPSGETVTRAMTLADVIELSKLGTELTWEDLKAYVGSEPDIISGFYDVQFDIDSEYYLLVGGGIMAGRPLYATLNARSSGASCDIKRHDVEDFIKKNKNAGLDYAIYKAIITRNADGTFPDVPSGLLQTESHRIFDIETKSGTPIKNQTSHLEETTVYLLYAYTRFYHSGGNLEERASVCTPAVITFTADPEAGYVVKEFWEPNPGSTYESDIRSKFPEQTADAILYPGIGTFYANDLRSRCLTKAESYLAEVTGAADTAGIPVAWVHKPGEEITAFRFCFDFPYTKITASCDHGNLIDAGSATNMTIDTQLTLGESGSLYWAPMLNGDYYGETEITFTLYDGDEELCSGRITVTGRPYGASNTFAYVAALDCDGLRMDMCEVTAGAAISLVDE